jgi:hypothetical protein
MRLIVQCHSYAEAISVYQDLIECDEISVLVGNNNLLHVEYPAGDPLPAQLESDDRVESVELVG